MSVKGINRRQFLHASGLVVASAAVSGGTLWLRPSIAWAMSFHTLDEHTAKTLLKMSRHLYPSPSIDDDQYARTVEGLDAKAKSDRALAKLLQDGVASLDASAQGKWLDASDEVSLQTLKGMEATPFFQTVRGSLVWSKPASGADGVSGDSGFVYGTESDGSVVAWRRADGERAWQMSRFKSRNLTAPLAVGRSLIVGEDTGTLHFVSREDGALLNRITPDGSAITVTPVLAGNTVVVVTAKGGVFGYRPE